MAASPKYKIHKPNGEYTASTKGAEEAACLCAFLGKGTKVKFGGCVIYTEPDDWNDSYDATASAIVAGERKVHEASYAKFCKPIPA